MKSGRRLIRVAAVIAVALGAGHVAQSGSGPGQAAQAPARVAGLVPRAAANTTRVSYQPDLPGPALSDIALPALPRAMLRPAAVAAPPLDPPRTGADAGGPRDCTPLLALSPRPGAMIDILLSAPCRAGERVVLRHSGLAVTYRANEAGAVFASIPALDADARVSFLFAGGETVAAGLALPEASEHRRFGVQWMGPRTFGVNAFEDGADYGGAGHVSAAQPHGPGPGLLPDRGFLSVLGDASVDMPMLAEIYTYPAGLATTPVLIEAAVTTETCGREVLGDLLTADRGNLRLADLSVTMPGCDAVGDYLVLKNLVPDLKLAAAN